MQTQQQQQQPTMGGAVENRIGVLETRMSGVEDGLKTILGELKSRSAINWAPIGILVGVLGSIGTMGFGWVNSSQGRVEVAIQKVEERAAGFVRRDDLDARWTAYGLRRDDLQRISDARMTRIEADVDKVAKDVVPRAELLQIWETQRVKDADIQRQLDGARAELHALSTPRDTFVSMQRRLDELEKSLRRPFKE